MLLNRERDSIAITHASARPTRVCSNSTLYTPPVPSLSLSNRLVNKDSESVLLYFPQYFREEKNSYVIGGEKRRLNDGEAKGALPSGEALASCDWT